MSSIKISCLRTIIHVTFSFGTNCPKPFPLKHGLGGISPVAAYRSEQPGAVCQGCIAPPYIGGLPLTGGPGCAIFRRRGGGISSRAAPFPMTGKGRGDWVEHERRFTYELYQQSLWAHDERDPPSRSTRPAEGTGRNALCGVSLLARDCLCFLLSGTPQKAGLMCGHLARKNALFARVSSLGFWGGNMIICPVRILLNTFHIFRSAGEQFLLFPGISTLGHFVPKLRNGASAPGRRQPGLGRLPNKHFGKYFSAARRKNLECVHTRIACQKRKCGYTCPACR